MLCVMVLQAIGYPAIYYLLSIIGLLECVVSWRVF